MQSADSVGMLEERIKALEGEVALYKQATENLRQDMQQFAYSVSHDLRAPVRAIEGFSRILEEDFAEGLSAEAKGFLKHIVQNSTQLSSQIDALLLFYRVGKRSPRPSAIETGELIAGILAEQKASHPELKVELVLKDVPEIMGDPELISDAFTQLVSNALKATRGKEDARIVVTGKAEDGARTCWIEDNGMGFEMREAEKLFQVFQKLHGADEFPGNGIGLAIVKQVATAHGGCVKAEGKPGKGARFSITLPHPPMRRAGETESI